MALAITGVIKGTSKRKLYEELGLESLKDRTWLRHLCYLHRIASTKMRPYLKKSFPPPPPPPKVAKNPGSFKPSRCCNEPFQNSFLSFTISEGNKLNPKVANINTRPIKNSIYDIYDRLGVKLFHRLRLELSHLREKKSSQTPSVHYFHGL